VLRTTCAAPSNATPHLPRVETEAAPCQAACHTVQTRLPAKPIQTCCCATPPSDLFSGQHTHARTHTYARTHGQHVQPSKSPWRKTAQRAGGKPVFWHESAAARWQRFGEDGPHSQPHVSRMHTQEHMCNNNHTCRNSALLIMTAGRSPSFAMDGAGAERVDVERVARSGCSQKLTLPDEDRRISLWPRIGDQGKESTTQSEHKQTKNW